jgi:hypothetical protein
MVLAMLLVLDLDMMFINMVVDQSWVTHGKKGSGHLLWYHYSRKCHLFLRRKPAACPSPRLTAYYLRLDMKQVTSHSTYCFLGLPGFIHPGLTSTRLVVPRSLADGEAEAEYAAP